MKRHVKQKWLVGERVRVTKQMESCLKDVPKHRLTALGRISGVHLKFSRTPNMRKVVYQVELDTELLGSHKWGICLGDDSMELEIINEDT